MPVDFLNGGTEQAGVGLRHVFFKYVLGGNPSVEWPQQNEGQHVWLWRYPTPVAKTHDNFAAILVARGGETVRLECNPEAKSGTAIQRATVRTPIQAALRLCGGPLEAQAAVAPSPRCPPIRQQESACSGRLPPGWSPFSPPVSYRWCPVTCLP